MAEDEQPIRELVVHHLREAGFEVSVAADGLAALRLARAGCDLIVLDIGLPGADGLDVARQLRRERRDVPIVILSARTEEVDRIVGFELGADDYVSKPFSPRELVARLKAVSRRHGIAYDRPPSVLQYGRLEIDEAAREVRLDGADLKFKPREFSLLFALAQNPGIALSRETLLERVWGFDFEGDARTVDVHVRRIRSKIGMADMPRHLRTVHGFGYKFARG